MKKGSWIAKYKELNDQSLLSKYAEKAIKIIEDFHIF